MKLLNKLPGVFFLSLLIVISSCDDKKDSIPPGEIIVHNSINFGEINLDGAQEPISFTIKGKDVYKEIVAVVSGDFEISIDNINFLKTITIPAEKINKGIQLALRCTPTVEGETNGIITITGENFEPVNITLTAVAIPGKIIIQSGSINFGEIDLDEVQIPISFTLKGKNVYKEVVAEVSGDFEISIDNINFLSTITIPAEKINSGINLKVRCTATEAGETEGAISISGEKLETVNITLAAVAVNVVKVSAFKGQRVAFGGGFKQYNKNTVNFPVNPENVKKITMFVKLRCPGVGCNAWDMFANIRVKDTESGEWYEMGRFITPYGVDNHQRSKGFDIDVTDFKSLLHGDVDLKAFIEVWGSDGWLLSVDFEIIEGTPDYKYYCIAPVLSYDKHSLAGIPYGVQNSFDVDKCVNVPDNAEQTVLRTIITGWGHATPKDADGRPCAEWCFRTHNILIDGVKTFTHDLKGIGCNKNPVNNQKGNWRPDRAGWCPGMEVPVRRDVFNSSMAGIEFCYKYELEQWVNDKKSGDAYYAISSFVIVKSNSPIEKPVVE